MPITQTMPCSSPVPQIPGTASTGLSVRYTARRQEFRCLLQHTCELLQQAPILLNFDDATTSSEVLETQDNFFRNDALLQWEEEAKEHEEPINPADAFTQSWENTRPAASLELAVASLNREQENPQAPGAFGDTTKSTRRTFFGLTCGNSPDDSPEETSQGEQEEQRRASQLLADNTRMDPRARTDHVSEATLNAQVAAEAYEEEELYFALKDEPPYESIQFMAAPYEKVRKPPPFKTRLIDTANGVKHVKPGQQDPHTPLAPILSPIHI